MKDGIITIRQPYATLAVLGIKKYESRGRNTPFRGRVLIHAARIKRVEFEYSMIIEAVYRIFAPNAAPWLARFRKHPLFNGGIDPAIAALRDRVAKDRGHIIGHALLSTTMTAKSLVRSAHPLTRILCDFENRKWAWSLHQPFALSPEQRIPHRGQESSGVITKIDPRVISTYMKHLYPEPAV